ncbi:MAG: SGNH/GDSL hydrolase family protein [Acidobacteria bacterium]|jgi:hypothetical protein|nr:SGNH/GDSL hydrolase family protein [Acidobacteriota bacterium]
MLLSRASLWLPLLFLLVPMLAFAVRSPEPPDPPGPASPPPLRVALIGASIARGWQLDGFAARTGRSDVVVEYVGEYGFDKSKSVAALLARGAADRPDVVILKECGAYFPGDQAAYEAMIRRWVAELRTAGIRTAVATVAPVAAPSGVIQHLKEFVKAWVLGREDQNAAIARYNAWLRAYAAAESLPLLDLEAALSVQSGVCALDPAYDSGDGLHLDPTAYPKLDAELGGLIARLASSPREMR